jgi:hypothetical protein
MTKAFLVALILPTLATPAFASYGPVSAKPSAIAPMIFAKNKVDKDAASDVKPALCSKPAIKPNPESRANRANNCPKPRPILM